MRFWKTFSGFMTVPLWAALISLLVACIPPVQAFLDDFPPVKDAITACGNCSVPVTLVTLGAYFYRPEKSPPVPSITGGSPEVPTQNLNSLSTSKPDNIRRMSSLKAMTTRPRLNFALPKRRNTHMSIASGSIRRLEEEEGNRGESLTIFVGIFSRMVLAPAILLPLLAWYVLKWDGINDDPVFVVTACLIIG
jgi:auxin efflux carrier family protein